MKVQVIKKSLLVDNPIPENFTVEITEPGTPEEMARRVLHAIGADHVAIYSVGSMKKSGKDIVFQTKKNRYICEVVRDSLHHEECEVSRDPQADCSCDIKAVSKTVFPKTPAQHTPGPWGVYTGLSSGPCHYVGYENTADANGAVPDICWMRKNPFQENTEAHHIYESQNIANARLIAAAPDYYEGCKDLPQITDEEPTVDYDKRVLAWFYCNAGKIYAANNKAKGR